MPNARDSAVPTTSAIRYDSAFTMPPCRTGKSTTTSTQVMMETASVFRIGEACVSRRAAGNSLNVNPDRGDADEEDDHARYDRGEQEPQLLDHTRQAQHQEKSAKLMKMDVPAAAK